MTSFLLSPCFLLFLSFPFFCLFLLFTLFLGYVNKDFKISTRPGVDPDCYSGASKSYSAQMRYINKGKWPPFVPCPIAGYTVTQPNPTQPSDIVTWCHYITVQNSTIQNNTIQYNTMQCNTNKTKQYNTIRNSAVLVHA